jgi:hypothetical protein
VESQKEAFVDVFNAIDWQPHPVISGLKKSDDIYANELRIVVDLQDNQRLVRAPE